ncbi:hypothetical protein Tco_1114010 [Tanacetum coccineum]|uniref:Uncharacterized protein n=1 Tax=Tanacetum coccineum TaxID=301880 RepID=A0ABQ5ITU4_9ASTR
MSWPRRSLAGTNPAQPDYVPGPEHAMDEIRDDGDDEMDIEEDEDADMDIDADEEDEDDEMDVEIDEEAEEEHSAPAYPVVVALSSTSHQFCKKIVENEVARLLAISSPPASPLSPWSSSPPQIPFPLSPPSPVLTTPPPSPIQPNRTTTLAYICILLIVIPRTITPSDPSKRGQNRGNLPTSDRLVGIRLTHSKINVGYGITDSWDEIVETLQGAPVSTDTELGAHMREFESMVRRDTDESTLGLEMSRDRRTHAHTRQLMETEAGMSREAWGRAMDASDLAHGGGQVTALQGQVMTLQGQVTALQGQQGPAGGPAQPELPEEAGSSS